MAGEAEFNRLAGKVETLSSSLGEHRVELTRQLGDVKVELATKTLTLEHQIDTKAAAIEKKVDDRVDGLAESLGNLHSLTKGVGKWVKSGVWFLGIIVGAVATGYFEAYFAAHPIHGSVIPPAAASPLSPEKNMGLAQPHGIISIPYHHVRSKHHGEANRVR